MFEVTVERTFAAGHALREYRGKYENVHGHNYRVEVTVAGDDVDSTGLLVDFVELKQRLDGVIAYLDHRFINDLAPFDKINPSAENIARYFFQEIEKGLAVRENGPRSRLARVKIWETDTSSATYQPR